MSVRVPTDVDYSDWSDGDGYKRRAEMADVYYEMSTGRRPGGAAVHQRQFSGVQDG
ncbi:hypothetical protein IMZ48_14230 [Candidatus Bathyarchaeota archaeon]|nr:hypothetical protein [Candidatus Bathyarchaeota archaeon]